MLMMKILALKGSGAVIKRITSGLVKRRRINGLVKRRRINGVVKRRGISGEVIIRKMISGVLIIKRTISGERRMMIGVPGRTISGETTISGVLTTINGGPTTINGAVVTPRILGIKTTEKEMMTVGVVVPTPVPVVSHPELHLAEEVEDKTLDPDRDPDLRRQEGLLRLVVPSPSE